MIVIILTKQKDTAYENTRLVQSFADKGINAILAHPNKFDIVVNNNSIPGINYNGVPIELPDLVLARTGSGITQVQLAIVHQFEQLGIPCFNPSSSIELVKDKLKTSQLLSHAGIAVPTSMLIRYPVNKTLVDDYIGYPCIVKVVTGSFGEGVHLCETQKDFHKITELLHTLGNAKPLLVQEYLGDRPGEDLRVLVIGNKVIGVMKRTAPKGDFRANITNGGTGERYPITPEIEEIVLNTVKVLGLEIAGIDLLFDTKGVRVCEANSNPGFSGFEQYCHIDVADQITEYIVNKLR